MEFANNGDLQQKIHKAAKGAQFFAEIDIWRIFIQIVKGLNELHQLGIMHRDLKSANVFLNKDLSVKLGDMNVSKLATKEGLNYTQTGTPYYASPEVWRDEPYSFKSDIWSLGCVLYEICTHKPPFMAENMAGLYKQIMKGKYERIPKQYSSELWHLIRSLLEHNPYSRPTCHEIMSNPFFDRFEKEIWPACKQNNWLSGSQYGEQPSTLETKGSLIKTIYRGSELSTQGSTQQSKQKKYLSKEDTKKWLRSLLNKMPKAQYQDAPHEPDETERESQRKVSTKRIKPKKDPALANSRSHSKTKLQPAENVDEGDDEGEAGEPKSPRKPKSHFKPKSKIKEDQPYGQSQSMKVEEKKQVSRNMSPEPHRSGSESQTKSSNQRSQDKILIASKVKRTHEYSDHSQSSSPPRNHGSPYRQSSDQMSQELLPEPKSLVYEDIKGQNRILPNLKKNEYEQIDEALITPSRVKVVITKSKSPINAQQEQSHKQLIGQLQKEQKAQMQEIMKRHQVNPSYIKKMRENQSKQLDRLQNVYNSKRSSQLIDKSIISHNRSIDLTTKRNNISSVVSLKQSVLPAKKSDGSVIIGQAKPYNLGQDLALQRESIHNQLMMSYDANSVPRKPVIPHKRQSDSKKEEIQYSSQKQLSRYLGQPEKPKFEQYPSLFELSDQKQKLSQINLTEAPSRRGELLQPVRQERKSKEVLHQSIDTKQQANPYKNTNLMGNQTQLTKRQGNTLHRSINYSYKNLPKQSNSNSHNSSLEVLPEIVPGKRKKFDNGDSSRVLVSKTKGKTGRTDGSLDRIKPNAASRNRESNDLGELSLKPNKKYLAQGYLLSKEKMATIDRL